MSVFIPAHHVVDGAPGAETAFVLHGILGSARNWLGFCRGLVTQTPGWRYVLVDLRNHGESRGAPPPHTVQACADDLAALADALGARPAAVLGHSFGGKVALAYAQRWGAGTLRHCFTLDSPIGSAPTPTGLDPQSVERVVAAVRTLPMPVATRGEVVSHLRGLGLSSGLADWMTTNLRPLQAGGFEWRFTLDAMDEMLASYLATDLWDFVEDSGAVRVHVIRGGRSDRWTPAALERLGHAPVSQAVLPDAGHWLHADDPEGLKRLLASVLRAGSA